MNDHITLTNILVFIQLVGLVFVVYRSYSAPNIAQDKSILTIEERCKHRKELCGKVTENLARNYEEVKESLSLLKENHINHIERDMNEMKQTQVRILTILENKEK